MYTSVVWRDLRTVWLDLSRHKVILIAGPSSEKLSEDMKISSETRLFGALIQARRTELTIAGSCVDGVGHGGEGQNRAWISACFGVLLLASSVVGVCQDTKPAVDSTVPAAAPASTTPVTTQEPAIAPIPAVVPPAAAKPVAVDAAGYVIGPEDTLQITVWREPSLSGAVPVRPDGMISMPLVGDLKASGVSPMQLSSDITAKLRKFIQEPTVSVTVTGVNSQRIYMIGEVGKVGAIPLTAGMTPLQAIAAAGGLNSFANSKRIYILRGVSGKQQKIPFNYKQALRGDNKQELALQPGDTIVVP